MSEPVADTTSSPLLSLSYGVGTDVGRRREDNQDSYGVINTEYLKFYIVADGMGGAKGGAIASSLAVKTVEEALGKLQRLSTDQIANAFSRANAEIFKHASEDESFAGMGTTMVGLAFFDTKMLVVNVGDSRAYRVRGDKIVQLTDDHTLVNDLVRNGAITPAQAENHPVAHMLTRSLGPCPDVDVEVFFVEDGPAKNDIYLLCSDGLYNVVSKDEMLTILKNKSIDEAIPDLIALANERGGPDNITIIIVQVDENYPLKASDFKEAQYPRTANKSQLPKTDAYDIRATREQYRFTKVKREHDDSDLQISSQSIAKNATATSKISKTDQSSLLHFKWAGLMILGLVMGFLLSETSSFFKSSNRQELRTVLINPLASEIAKVPMISYNFNKPEMEIGVFVSKRETGVKDTQLIPDSFSVNKGLTKGQVEGVTQRKKTIQDQLQTIRNEIEQLDNPQFAQLSERKEKIQLELGKLDLNQVYSVKELNDSSKNLASWIDRKQRLSTADPVDLASEVAFSSSYVRERKELFEKATWAYLREVEVWRYSPNDQELTKKISELGKAREQRRNELAEAVAKAVDQGKLDAEEKISLDSTKSKEIEIKVLKFKNELKFIELIFKNDAAAKQAYRADIIKRSEIAQSELDELARMLP